MPPSKYQQNEEPCLRIYQDHRDDGLLQRNTHHLRNHAHPLETAIAVVIPSQTELTAELVVVLAVEPVVIQQPVPVGCKLPVRFRKLLFLLEEAIFLELLSMPAILRKCVGNLVGMPQPRLPPGKNFQSNSREFYSHIFRKSHFISYANWVNNKLYIFYI